MAVITNGGPAVNWTVLISALGLFGLTASAGWTVFQTQINGLQRQLDSHEADVVRINAELIARRKEFIEKPEFDQFEKRIQQYMATPFLKSSEFEAWREGQKEVNAQFMRRVELLESKK